MDYSKILFWNVDTQVDFVEPEGKLYVSGAEMIKPIWQKLTDFAKRNLIKVVNTCDYHFDNSKELSNNPDFINTFPPHCMAKTTGAEFIDETKPEHALVVNWDTIFKADGNFNEFRNIIIKKDAFDVFSGNPYSDLIIKNIAPEKVVVYGVTTNVCVNDAVVGLTKRVNKVVVISDAIKELPNIPLPFENWKKLGVELVTFREFLKLSEN